MQPVADIDHHFSNGSRSELCLLICQEHDRRGDFNGVKVIACSNPLSFAMKDVPRLYSASILIIDDSCDTASMLCELMALKGYENVSWTTDSDALTSLCSGNRYELILLDMHMPAISGLDVMHYLRDSEHATCVPVIAISGDQRYKLVALEAGACAFLLKPFDYAELEATVFNALAMRYGSISSHRTACKEAPRSRMTKGAESTVFTSSLPPPP